MTSKDILDFFFIITRPMKKPAIPRDCYLRTEHLARLEDRHCDVMAHAFGMFKLPSGHTNSRSELFDSYQREMKR